jgi:hypothetical protein
MRFPRRFRSDPVTCGTATARSSTWCSAGGRVLEPPTRRVAVARWLRSSGRDATVQLRGVAAQSEPPQVSGLPVAQIQWHRTASEEFAWGSMVGVPRQRTFLFVIQSSSSAIICHSTFLDSPSAERRVRRDAAWRPNGDAARCFCLGNLHWQKRLPRDGRTGQIGHESRDALPSKIPHRRSQARAEQSGLTRDS